ncbi:MAG: SdiA-regulated domain-containing protein [Flavobacterium sp.]|nr:SdiA-regulated domain-containing protein [Flavobacterium sp.]
MKKLYFKQTIVATLLFFSSQSDAQTLLHYWNFNNNASVATITTPTLTNISGAASLTATISGISAIDFTGGTGSNFDVLNLNTRNADVAGTHLRFNDPIGSALVFAVPTSGYEDVIVKFATRRSGSGAGTQVWSYSTDGTNYTFFANVIPNNGDPALATLDFSSISSADNNPNFKLKVEFQLAPGGAVGNNRFDNFTIEGTVFNGIDTTIPMVSFLPANAATGIFSTIQPSIAFSENVRLANDDAITNTNVDAIVELRLNNASGALVPFDAAFALNKITIIPTTTLANNQLYYVGLLANTVEDASNNAITTVQSSSFTTTTPTVNLSVNNSVGKESGSTVITVTSTSNFAVNGNQTIDLSVAGTNITAGDYSLSNNSITILNGQTMGSASFTVTDDALAENTESAVLTLSNPSAGITLGSTISQPITIIDNDTPLNIDLSNYVRVGRYDLPEPTRTAAPTNNLLGQEASGVTYNWDTDTLFIVGDGTTSVLQVSKTGQLIDTMTLAQGSSPQGTEFYDSEGITYIGNGQFVMTEERDRQVVLFTYAAGTTLTRSNAKTVKLGTFVNNTGTEGLTYDPLTNSYIVLKEISPVGIFQTGIDFNAGTATNGSATTDNSTNLFDPALLGLTDVADVFALSNLPALDGQPLYNNLLVLSQENAKVVNVDRNGAIANSLTIVSDPGNPLDAPNQQHEGLTMDRDGVLYIVNENGGGNINYPQLWVYAPSSLTNQAPTAVALTNTINSVLENSNTTSVVKISDILITDDGLGTNNLSLSGADASFFQITGAGLYIKAGTVLDYETKTSYAVTINVDDTTVGSTPDASVNFSLAITDVVNETVTAATVIISEVTPWSSGNALVGADWFELTNNGTTALDITGWKVDDNSNLFANALALTGITSIAPGESVIFIEAATTDTAAITTITNTFKSTWFGTNVPAGFQIGTYTGGGIGLGTGGDAVNIFDASGNLKSSVTFVSATTNFTFNNALGLTSTTISTLSQVGVNDAFAAINDTNQIGSPGTVGKLFISEVAPWSSDSSPVAADWFEVTNTKAVAVDITGWKIDDNSQSPIGAAALNGISIINPGESVIFIETTDLAGKTTAFLSNWFGTNPPAGLRIGSYSGSGGLGTGGDQVNLYNSTSNIQEASIWVGASPSSPFATFDNTAGVRTNITQQTKLSAVGVNGAFVAANNATEIGSPGVHKVTATTLGVNSPSEIANSFKVITFPVPYASTFQLELTSVSNEPVEMKVYDMTGKLVEIRQFETIEIKNQNIGSYYPSGIYNIIITQGKEAKTLRVIKK